MSGSCSTGPRAQFNEFIRKVIGDLGIDGSDILQIVIMLRQRNLREDLVFCLHNKAPNMRLSKSSFAHLVDVLRALLREANNTSDHTSISAAFRVSQLFGRTMGTFEYSLLSSLSSHEVWRNESYWLQATDALLSSDIFRWQALSSVSRKKGIFGSDFKDAQVYSFFAINRVQAVAFGSMRRLDVSVAVIASYLEASMHNYGLSAANIDITQRPHINIVMGLLDKGIEHSVHPDKKEARMLKSLSTSDSVEQPKGLGQSNFAEFGEVSPAIHARCKHTAIGFCSLLEVVFTLASLSDPVSPMAKLLLKIKTNRAAEGEMIDKIKLQKYELKCVCGMPLNEWKPLGLFDSSAREHREYMSYFLCELCFRQSISPLGQMGSVINGGVGKCVVPSTRAEQGQSFLCLFYGNIAARNGFQNSSGQHVRLHALGNFTTVNVKFKKRGKIKKKTTGSMSSPMKSQKSISSDGMFDSDTANSDDDFADMLSRDSLDECLESVDGGDSDSDGSKGLFSGLSDDSEEDGGGHRGRQQKQKSNSNRNFGRSRELQKFVVMLQAGVDVVKIKASALAFTRHLARTLFLDPRAQDLGWVPPGRGTLIIVPKSSMPVASIRSIKVGSGKLDQCISIISDAKTLVIKVEDSKHYQQILDGFMALTEDNKKKKNTVGRQVVAL